MPREFIHWGVVDEVFDRLFIEAPELRKDFEGNQTLAKIGAVVHDLPYFLPSDKDGFSEIAAVLHGRSGEDTFEPLRRVAKVIREEPSSKARIEAWALLIGMISHIATDSNFHPLVYFWTGDYNHPDSQARSDARQRHRYFEVCLDSWLAEKQTLSRPQIFATLLAQISETKKDGLYSLLATTLPTPTNLRSFEPLKAKWKFAFEKYSRSQKLFHSPATGALIRSLRVLPIRGIAEIDSLFSFRRKSLSFMHDKEIPYQNPVSGRNQREGLQLLFDKSVSDTLCLVRELLPQMDCSDTSGNSLGNSLWAGRQGPSLSFGLPGVKAEDAKYFRSDPPPKP